MQLFNYTALGLNKTLDSVIRADHLEAYIQNLPANTVLYHCYYNLEQRQSFKDYQGLLSPVFDSIHIDMDSKDDNGALAFEQAKSFCKRLKESGIGFHLYFSGNKGFHVAIHKSALGLNEPLPHAELSQNIKSFLYGLKTEYSTVDTAIHDPSRKFRAYRSQHEKSGLYKIRLTGIGLVVRDMSIDEIRNLALMQPVHKYAHPESCSEPSVWLKQYLLATPSSPSRQKPKVKELNQGETLQDDSLRFKNFADKRCIKQMLSGTVLPQFNRHDIELALIVEMRQQGQTLDEAIKLMEAWGQKVYTSEPDRLKDIDRQVRDIYKKDLEADKLYQYGCYGDVKSAYCSAKCKIYNNLDSKRRAEPLDANKAQKLDNEVRRNPALEKSEGELADEIMKEFPELCKASGQYFQWSVTHWRRIDGDMFEDLLLKASMKLYGNQAPIKKVKALAEHVIAKIKIAPETNHFFASCPNKFNFTDCTAVMTQENGVLKLETREHRPDDYLAYCAPFPLKAKHKLPKGTEFSKYMETRMQDVGEEGIRIIKQMLGAALIPYVPRIFFIEGITNAGKSTLAKIIMRLLGEENVSEVLPILRGGGADRFNWEPSIGKLANIVLELPKGAELDVNTLKMVRDKSPVSIDRKSQKHVKATLPFLHIYCCNQMPQSFEGNTGALNNRVSMLFFKPGYLNGSSGIVEFADAIWNDDAGSVLEAAREGLNDLIESGFHYFNGNASAKATRDWQKMTDTIQLYIDDVNSGECDQPHWEMTQWEKASLVYSHFKDWCAESGKRPMGKHNFYKELETRFGVPMKTRGEGGVRLIAEKLFNSRGQMRENSKCETNASDVSSLDF